MSQSDYPRLVFKPEIIAFAEARTGIKYDPRFHQTYFIPSEPQTVAPDSAEWNRRKLDQSKLRHKMVRENYRALGRKLNPFHRTNEGKDEGIKGDERY